VSDPRPPAGRRAPAPAPARPGLTWVLDARTGAALVTGPDAALAALRAPLEALLGPGRATGCALPLRLLPPPPPGPDGPDGFAVPRVRVAGYYHDSLVEGPGRRSSALLVGCPLACPGCRVPHLHPEGAGAAGPVDRLAAALLDPAHARDGVSLLGGEPFAQPVGLLGLVRALRDRGCRHVLAYSGYTYAQLRRIGRARPAVAAALDELDVLIDGPYVRALARTAGPWTGSGNQRVVAARRTAGRTLALLGGRDARDLPLVWDDRLGQGLAPAPAVTPAGAGGGRR
jgi:anaerobic ribonucleoside-triphosphate reductase activating protein